VDLPINPHAAPLCVRSLLSNNSDDDTELQPTTPTSATSSSSANYLKRKTSGIYKAVISNGVVSIVGGRISDAPVAPASMTLVGAYATSDIAAGIKADGEQLRSEVVRADNGDAATTVGAVRNELPDVVLDRY